MKNIQLLKIIIWQKDLLNLSESEKSYIEYDFKPGMLNIIHGLSQTGKSAIIPIIDYCLCSSKNKIPIGTIRKSSSWFGIVLDIDGNMVLFARENCEIAPKKIMYLENFQDIPNIPVNNIDNLDEFKKSLNDKIGIPFITPSNSFAKRNSRLSFRDLISFNFQPQYIVANPNCLLYKMDTSKYKDLLIPVFNIIIGAETIENYEKRILIEELNEELKKLTSELNASKDVKNNQLQRSTKLISRAIEYGLIDQENAKYLNNEYNAKQAKFLKRLLEEISKKSLKDINISIEQYDSISDLIENIENDLNPLNQKLLILRNQRNSLEEFIKLRKKYAKSVETSIQRLDIANFIYTFCTEHNEDTASIDNLSELCDRAKQIQDSLKENIIPENSMYLKKFYDIEKKINDLSKVIEEKKNKKENLLEQKEQVSILESVYEDIIIRSKLLIDSLNSDNTELQNRIKEIQEKIKSFKLEDVDNNNLDNILKLSQKYLPAITEFHNVSSFDFRDMTIKVKEYESSDEDYYLWETGSGSNWVAFHIAMLLGFHSHFIENELPIFNFIVFDQPSQVYFPKEIKDRDVKLEDVDKQNVKIIFNTLNQAVIDNNDKLQVIVTDHADESIWGSIPETQRHIVGDWSSGEALIPTSWKEKYDKE